MKIDIKGHSGCNIEISNLPNSNELCIIKSTNDKAYFNRLEKQAIKQINDYNSCNLNNITIPKIYNLNNNEDTYSICMEYIYGKNYISYFENASLNDLDIFIKIILSYLDYEFNNSTIEYKSKQLFINKYESILKKCNHIEDQELLKKGSQFFNELPETIELNIGKCHGDLTFSNILFTNNGICLIDYLDSFVETPIQDIVKLRQDTKYLWSRLLYDKKYDKIRLEIISSYIDRFLTNYLNDKNVEQQYNILNVMNWFRILPYTKNKITETYVTNILNNLLK